MEELKRNILPFLNRELQSVSKLLSIAINLLQYGPRETSLIKRLIEIRDTDVKALLLYS